MKVLTVFWAFLLVVPVLFVHTCNGFYMPEGQKHVFSAGDALFAKVKSLTSIDSALSFSYYSLPYCKPHGGTRRSTTNLGELLMGAEINNSPYQFRMNVNQSVHICTTPPLTEHQVKLLKHRTRYLYQVNLMLDSLPVMRYAKYGGVKIQWTGFPVGYTPFNSFDDYIINHLKFTVFIHEHEKSSVEIVGPGEVGMGVISEADKKGFEIVGFHVEPCSVKHNHEVMKRLKMYDSITSVNCPMEIERSQIIKEKETVSFTYQVAFVKSDIRWRSRWDAYLKMEGDRVHWFSIINSILVVFFLAGIIIAILMRTVGRDLKGCEELGKETLTAQKKEDLPGWKLIAGDVLREPGCSKLLCVIVGDGVQITGMAAVTITFSALGFMSPASPGILLSGIIMFYLCFSFIGGYTAVRLWRTIKGTSEGWRSLCWSVACFFPGIIFVIKTASNFLLLQSRSTGAIPFPIYFTLLFLWFCISIPLTLMGGSCGTRAKAIKHPVQTSQVPREIPARKFLSWLFVVGAGTLPFGTLFIELFFILSSIWLGRFYYVFGFLLIVFVLLFIVCAGTSLILTYSRLNAEDWQWWWKAFFASGSCGLFVFLYCINYLVFDLQSLDGPVSVTLYLGNSLIIATAVMFSTGTIGFLVSFYFMHYLYSSAEIENKIASQKIVYYTQNIRKWGECYVKTIRGFLTM